MKNNKFLPGLLTGLTSALIVFLVVFNVYVTKVESKQIGSATKNSVESTVDKKTTLVTEADSTKIVAKLNLLERIIDEYYLNEVDNKNLKEGIYKGLLDSLQDLYSCYYTKEEYKTMMEKSSGVYCGIGASVSQNVTTGIITIVKPFVTGPAYEAGLLPGDIIYKVEGSEVTGVDLSEVVSKMKGKEGTKVTISILREGEKEPREFKIERRMVENPTIEYEMLEQSIGYIQISEFEEITPTQFRKAIDKLEKDGMKGLVIDLRNNLGGRLDAVVDMLDRMLPKGLIVYQEDKYGNREEERSTGKEKFEKPLAVLMNGMSASASEVFAGAIQDYEIGTLVGTKSFGKGIVQSILPLNDGTAVKLTVSKYYTPKGRNIHEIGIEPDVKIELDETLRNQGIIEHEKDNQLQKAIETVKEEISRRE